MMENEWKAECSLLLADNLKTPYEASTKTFNLITPSSTCPHCNTQIKPWFNLPVFGWLFLRGKAACCGNKISVRYPSIELLTGLSGLVIAYYFGVTEQAALYLILTYALISLIFIDIDHMLLPDQITLPLLWLVLIASVMGLTIEPSQAIIGAAAGYLVFWSVYWVFKLLTGKEGMGYGDFKLLAVFGGLLGWQSILTIVLLSSVVGAIIGIAQIILQGKDKTTLCFLQDTMTLLKNRRQNRDILPITICMLVNGRVTELIIPIGSLWQKLSEPDAKECR